MNDKIIDKKYACDPEINYMVCNNGKIIELSYIKCYDGFSYASDTSGAGDNSSHKNVINFQEYLNRFNEIA